MLVIRTRLELVRFLRGYTGPIVIVSVDNDGGTYEISVPTRSALVAKQLLEAECYSGLS